MLDETGVMGIACPRHGVILKAADIYGGEKYLYLDLLLESYLKSKVPQKLLVYYDIACRYQKHYYANSNISSLWRRKTLFAVPKFHVYAHVGACLSRFHPSSVRGAGLTDGEVLERIWSHVGLFYSILKEMLPINRSNLLEVIL